MRRLQLPVVRIISAFALLHSASGEDGVAAFAEHAKSRIEARFSVEGEAEGWYFLTQEMRHLSKGAFWEKPWEDVAANATNPVPSIVEFHEMLADRGIRLLVVPVPAKASVYPEKLSAEFDAEDPVRLKSFLAAIEAQGVEVLDLQDEFLTLRKEEPDTPWYCQQDAHYSPVAIEHLVDRIMGELELPAGESDLLQRSDWETLSITGDLIAGSEWEGSVPAESLRLRRVSQGGQQGVEPDPGSPYLVLGDSHTLVFHEGETNRMHCRGAGVVDHLSFRVGAPVDLVGIQMGGLFQVRKNLFYHATEIPGYWDNKKAVIWIFTARDFTESTTQPARIPLERN